MKKGLLAIVVLFALCVSKTFAANYTWTGLGTDNNWNTPANWSSSSYPSSSADNVTIPFVSTRLPTLNVALTIGSLTISGTTNLTLSSNLTISGAFTSNSSATIGGTGNLSAASLSLTGSPTLTLNASLSISGLLSLSQNTTSTISVATGKTLVASGITLGGSQATTLNITGGGTSTFTGTTNFQYQSALNIAAASTVNFSAGSTLKMNGNAPNSPTPAISNSGTLNFNGTSGSGVTISGYYGEIYSNSGTMTMSYANLTLAGGGSVINNTGTFTMTSSTITMSNPSSFNNSTTNGKFTLTGSTITMPQGAFITNSATGNGFFTINGGSSISFGYGSYINNSGIFYAGTSGSSVALNVNSQNAYITNSGTFNLGPTSIISLTGYDASVTNTGTFRLQSDATGTGSVGAITAGGNPRFNGTYIVERYFTGGASSNRGYRLMSSPVNNTGTLPMSGSPTYNFSSLKTNLLITCKNGSGGGCDVATGYTANGPTILFYNSLTALFTFPNSLSDAASTPVGRGFYFFFRGNNTNNVLTKLVNPGSGYTAPEANVVGLFSGTLNQGSLTFGLTGTGTSKFNLVGNPYPSTISLTASVLSAANTTGFVYLYNPSAKSCNPFTGTTPIASGQGFFVKLNSSSTSGNLNFTESLKSSVNLGSGLLMGTPGNLLSLNTAAAASMSTITDVSNTSSNASETTQQGYLSLKLVQDTASFDIAQLRFSNSYNKKYDELEDADDLNGSGQTAFFGALTADNRAVAIASQPIEKQKTSIFLNVDMSVSGQYKIEKMDLSGIPDAYEVWLKDHYKKDSLDLRSNTTYDFNLDKNNPFTYGSSRFEVVIRKKILPAYQLIKFAGKRVNNDNVLQWSTLNEYAYTSFVLERSLDGITYEHVLSKQSDSKGNYAYTDISASNWPYYRLKQIDINDNITYTTAIIENTVKGIAVFTVYPNPTSDVIHFSLPPELSTGDRFKLNIYNSTGSLVQTVTHNAKNGEQNVSALMVGIYTIQLLDISNNKQVASAKFVKQ